LQPVKIMEEELDYESVELIEEAMILGLSMEEIRGFLLYNREVKPRVL
jgi:hypothetical protein